MHMPKLQGCTPHVDHDTYITMENSLLLTKIDVIKLLIIQNKIHSYLFIAIKFNIN
jgi:hypothetical protein